MTKTTKKRLFTVMGVLVRQLKAHWLEDIRWDGLFLMKVWVLWAAIGKGANLSPCTYCKTIILQEVSRKWTRKTVGLYFICINLPWVMNRSGKAYTLKFIATLTYFKQLSSFSPVTVFYLLWNSREICHFLFDKHICISRFYIFIVLCINKSKTKVKIKMCHNALLCTL